MAAPIQKRTRPDPKPGEAQTRAAAVRSVDVEKRTVDVVASTEAVDSHGTVLVQDWNLDRFNKNPVVLWAHGGGWGSTDELPLGRCTRCEVVNNQLEATIEFAGADINDRAERVFQAFRQGFIRAVSVGFNPHSYRWEMRDDIEVLVFSDNELVELSVVPVGSNPDALARALAARSTPAAKPAPETTTMTEEERKLLAFAMRALELLGTTDPAAGEATLRGHLDAAKAHETDAAALTELRGEVATMRRDALLEGAVRAAQLPPRADWTEEQRTYLDSLSPLAAKGQRSPLESYLRTLPVRVPTPGKRETPASERGTGDKAPAAKPPTYARSVSSSHVERAKAEKTSRRATGHTGPRVTDPPATQDGD